MQWAGLLRVCLGNIILSFSFPLRTESAARLGASAGAHPLHGCSDVSNRICSGWGYCGCAWVALFCHFPFPLGRKALPVLAPLQVPTRCMAVLMSQTGYAVGGATAGEPGQLYSVILLFPSPPRAEGVVRFGCSCRCLPAACLF